RAQRAHDGEAQAGAAPVAGGGEEGSEDARRVASAALTRRRRRQWGHLLQDLGIERFSLRERAEAGVDRGEEEPESTEPSREKGRRLAPAAVGERALRIGDRRQHLSHAPPEPSLHDLLENPPEVRRCLVVVLAGPGDGHAPDEMPLDETADVDRDVALALLERGRDLVERERPLVEVEEPEDAAAERRQDPRRRGRR